MRMYVCMYVCIDREVLAISFPFPDACALPALEDYTTLYTLPAISPTSDVMCAICAIRLPTNRSSSLGFFRAHPRRVHVLERHGHGRHGSGSPETGHGMRHAPVRGVKGASWLVAYLLFRVRVAGVVGARLTAEQSSKDRHCSFSYTEIVIF